MRFLYYGASSVHECFSEMHMGNPGLENKTKERKMKSKYIDNLIEDSLFTRMTSGVIKVGLVALVGTIIGVGLYGCKKSEDYYNRGIARSKKGETDRAISDFTKAIKMNPRFANAYYYRGLMYLRKKGDYDQVISDYTKAIEINPRLAVAYAERALVYYLKREYDKAWEDVHKAESLGQQIRFLKGLREASGRKK